MTELLLPVRCVSLGTLARNGISELLNVHIFNLTRCSHLFSTRAGLPHALSSATALLLPPNSATLDTVGLHALNQMDDKEHFEVLIYISPIINGTEYLFTSLLYYHLAFLFCEFLVHDFLHLFNGCITGLFCFGQELFLVFKQ